jgi:hypothetical protein
LYLGITILLQIITGIFLGLQPVKISHLLISSVGQGIIPLSIQEAFNFPWTFLYTASLFVIVLGY